MIAVETLCPCELFAGLSEEELTQIAAIADEETYEAGQLICAEREQADRLFILYEGCVQLHIHLQSPVEPDWEMTIEEVEPGRIFGWSSLVKQRRFTASAKAMGPVRVMTLRADELNTLFERDPHIGFVVMKQLAEVIASRLHRTREVCQKDSLENPS
jgi:CRP/FNR family transcriptional regulator